jgi:hypothetical protein
MKIKICMSMAVLCVGVAFGGGKSDCRDAVIAVQGMAEVSRQVSPSGNTVAVLYESTEPAVVEEGTARRQVLQLAGPDSVWNLQTLDEPFDWFGSVEFIDEERVLVSFKNVTAERAFICSIKTQECKAVGSGSPRLLRKGKNKGLIQLTGQKHFFTDGGAFWVDVLVDLDGQVVEVLSASGPHTVSVPLTLVLDPDKPHSGLRQSVRDCVSVVY